MKSSGSLWDFSLRVYARPGVERACLELQDSGLDVNLLLFCCWGATRGRLPTEALARLVVTAEPWRVEVIEQLRTARISLRGASTADARDSDVAALRARVRAAELEAERIQQVRLEQIADAVSWDGETGELTARECLGSYLSLAGASDAPGVQRSLETLVAACADEWPTS